MLLSAAFVMLITANSLLEGGAFPWKPEIIHFISAKHAVNVLWGVV